jgi:hypothetical protein
MQPVLLFEIISSTQRGGGGGDDAALSMCGTNNRLAFPMHWENKLF